jgi:hypothetical protein
MGGAPLASGCLRVCHGVRAQDARAGLACFGCVEVYERDDLALVRVLLPV